MTWPDIPPRSVCCSRCLLVSPEAADPWQAITWAEDHPCATERNES